MGKEAYCESFVTGFNLNTKISHSFIYFRRDSSIGLAYLVGASKPSLPGPQKTISTNPPPQHPNRDGRLRTSSIEHASNVLCALQR